jgi:hypothetical protein
MTGAGDGWGCIKVWREAAHMAASLTLCRSPVLTWCILKARLFLERAGFNVDSDHRLRLKAGLQQQRRLPVMRMRDAETTSRS